MAFHFGFTGQRASRTGKFKKTNGIRRAVGWAVAFALSEIRIKSHRFDGIWLSPYDKSPTPCDSEGLILSCWDKKRPDIDIKSYELAS